MPYASGSDSMIYTGEYHSVPPQRPPPSQSGRFYVILISRSAVKLQIDAMSPVFAANVSFGLKCMHCIQ